MVADDIVDDLKKLLPGLSGQIIPHKTMLIVSDTAFNVARIKSPTRAVLRSEGRDTN